MFTRLRKRLRLQLLLLIVGLAMATASGYVLLTMHLVQQQIAQDQFQLQRILVTRMASQLDQDMHNRTVELKFLAGLQRLRDPARAAADKQALLLEK